MRRRLFTLCSALSLLLCVAVCVLWVLSYRYFIAYKYLNEGSGRFANVVLLRGGFQIAQVGNLYNRHGEWGWEWGRGWQVTPLKSPTWLGNAPGVDWQIFGGPVPYREAMGFRWLLGKLRPGTPFWSVRVPLWFIALASAILPAFAIMRSRRHHARVGSGHCPTCGYDLRATPDRCPECGTSVPARKPAVLPRRPPPPAPSSPSSP